MPVAHFSVFAAVSAGVYAIADTDAIKCRFLDACFQRLTDRHPAPPDGSSEVLEEIKKLLELCMFVHYSAHIVRA